MSEAHRRRKQPEQVRRLILDAAVRLGVREGVSAVTVDAVAAQAGVTKGGFFHHFPSKRALIVAVFSDLLARLDEQIDTLIASDDQARGRFTRAYVRSMFDDLALGSDNPWSALSVSMVAEPDLRALWAGWIADRLERHADTDRDPALEVVRLAADGAWLAFLLGPEGPAVEDAAALCVRLVDMTTAPEPGER